VQPLGTTVLGETVWPVLPGRAPGQEAGLKHLLWGGPGDAIHLYTGGRADGPMEYPGRDSGTVSGPCDTAAAAQQAAGAYLAGLDKEPALEVVQVGPPAELATLAAELRARVARHAGQAPAGDQTARILGEHGTPEQRLEYALMGAEGRKSGAYAAAWAQCEAAGKTAAAKQRYYAVYETVHAQWTVEVASVVAGYAEEIGATALDPGSGTDDLGSPYHRGWSSGANMLVSDITHRPAGYGDGQWGEFVAGWAEGAQAHAEATVGYAQAVQPRASPAKSPRGTASAGSQPVTAQGALTGAAARDGSAGPGPGAGTEFPGAPPDGPGRGGRGEPRPRAGLPGRMPAAERAWPSRSQDRKLRGAVR
jgi:hypothetical protein